MASTDYERLYCHLVSKGQGAGLPAFEDFRRNTPRVQALLLKRPAQRAGLDLPSVSDAQPEREESSVSSKPPRPSQRPPTTTGPIPGTAVRGLAGCDLLGEVIHCPDRRLTLVRNQSNRELAPEALAEHQRLELPAFRGDPDDEQALRSYLSDAYDRYLARMLDIGLGGATMSFSQFYHSYHRHQAQGVDFAARMEATFQYLKQDKKTKTVPARLHDRLPEDIATCTVIRPQLVVCDNVATNWVYQGAGAQP